MIEIIAFDADDTLWHNEKYYTESKDVFVNILKRFHDEEWIGERLDKTEMQNLNRYGYGIKSFTLSMIETAIQLTEGRINGNEIQEIISIAWEMLRQPIEVFPGVHETIETLKNDYKILLITKGDLFEQEAKIARSGLGDLFDGIEIVSEKNPAAYQEIVNRYQVKPENFLMAGNSLKSDVLPVVAIGGIGVHIPFETTWVHELVAEKDLEGKEFAQLENLSELPDWIKNNF